MTIFTPHNSKFNISLKLAFWVALLIALALSSVYFYNKNVALKHSFSFLEVKMQELQSSNADFKNELYKILDSKNLNSLVGRLPLIKETAPRYLEGDIVAFQ